MSNQGNVRASRVSFVDRRLKVQLRIFLIIFSVLTALVIVRIFDEHVNALWALLGLVAGIVVGRVLARTKVLSWNEQDRVVVGRMDFIGGAILVVYVIFVIFRGRLLGDVLHDAHAVGVVGLSLTAGAMLGRVVFTFSGIRQVLAAVRITPPPRSP